MKIHITSISLFQTAKVIALLFFVFSLPILGLMMLMSSFTPGSKPPMTGMMLAIPFIQLILGFIFTITGAWVYNLVAKWGGGIEFTTSETENS